jgi:predicted kinase
MKKPKVIFLLGSAGSGKTTVSKHLDLKMPILNVDNEYIFMLDNAGLGQKISDFDHGALSSAAKFMGTAQKHLREDIQRHINEKLDFCLDTTGGSYKALEKTVQQCKQAGYDIFCIVCWATPYTCLKRNYERERTLKPIIVTRSWRDVNKNYLEFQKLFEPNFYTVNTELSKEYSFLKYWSISQALQDFPVKGSGKKYTEQEFKEKQIETWQIFNDINRLFIQWPWQFDQVNDIKQQITKFLK